MRQTWDAAMHFRADAFYILRDSCFVVIAVLLFPDMEQDPAFVDGAQRSNLHVLWGMDNLMDRRA